MNIEWDWTKREEKLGRGGQKLPEFSFATSFDEARSWNNKQDEIRRALAAQD